MKTTSAKNQINERSNGGYSNKEISGAYHSVKSKGGDTSDLGQIEKAANDNRSYLNTPSSHTPNSGGYKGYAYQESDI